MAGVCNGRRHNADATHTAYRRLHYSPIGAMASVCDGRRWHNTDDTHAYARTERLRDPTVGPVATLRDQPYQSHSARAHCCDLSRRITAD